MGTGSFPGVKSGRGVTLTPHPFLVPWSRKSRAIPLLALWAVRSVENISACTKVHFTVTFTFTGEDSGGLGCFAMSTFKSLPTFRIITVPSFSGSMIPDCLEFTVTMEALRFSKISVCIYPSARLQIPKDLNFYEHSALYTLS